MRNPDLRIVSQAYSLEAGQAHFRKPVVVGLSYDPSKLPAGTKLEDLFPVLEQDGVCEILKAQRVDPEKRELTFALDRLVPRIHYSGALAVRQAAPTLGVALFTDHLEVVEADASLELRSLGPAKAQASGCLDYLRKTVAKIRKDFVETGFVPLPPLRIAFVPPAWIPGYGQACGDDLVFISEALAKTGDDTLAAVLTHECFHLVQNASYKGFEVGSYSTAWPDESTAEWIEYRFYPSSAVTLMRASSITPAFFQAPFFRPKDVEHPYRSFTFWCFLDERLGAVNVLKRLYIRPQDDDPKRQAAPEAVQVLEEVARQKGLALADLFLEYLVHYAWRKDREPFTSMFGRPDLRAHAVSLQTNLGKPGDIMMDPMTLTGGNVPEGEGGDRKLGKSFPKVTGEPYGVVRTYNLSSMTKANERGALEISLEGPEKEGRLLVFPYDNSGVKGSIQGAPGRPVTVPDWHTLGGAIAWIVDTGPEGRREYRLSAKLAAPPALQSDLVCIQFLDAAGRYVEKQKVDGDFKIQLGAPGAGVGRKFELSGLLGPRPFGCRSGDFRKEYLFVPRLKVSAPGFQTSCSPDTLVTSFAGVFVLPIVAGAGDYTLEWSMDGKAYRQTFRIQGVVNPDAQTEVDRRLADLRRYEEQVKKSRGIPDLEERDFSYLGAELANLFRLFASMGLPDRAAELFQRVETAEHPALLRGFVGAERPEDLYLFALMKGPDRVVRHLERGIVLLRARKRDDTQAYGLAQALRLRAILLLEQTPNLEAGRRAWADFAEAAKPFDHLDKKLPAAFQVRNP